MKNLSKREVILVIVLFVAICGALYYNLIFSPFITKNSEISIKISETKSKLNDYKIKKAAIKTVDGKITVINEDLGKKLDKVLYSIDPSAIIVMLNKELTPFATSTDFGFSSTYEDLKSNYITTVEVSFKCNPDGFSKILTNLTNSDYVNRVINSSLMLSDPVTNAWDAMISIDILTKSNIPTKTEFVYP